jgi:hypothetical protein
MNANLFHSTSAAAKTRTPSRSNRRHCSASWILLLLLLPAVVQAQFTFTTNNGTITITKYTGRGGGVTVPDTTNGLPVTSIGTSAFSYSVSLTSVIVPNTVTSIGEYAFSWCTSLTNIAFPDAVTNIGHWVLHGCTNLTSRISVVVLGAVKNPRKYSFPPGIWLAEAINQAGGFIEPPSREVIVAHKDGSREQYSRQEYGFIRVHQDRAPVTVIDGSDTMLHDGDVVSVASRTY